jgi:hypothetical protein
VDEQLSLMRAGLVFADASSAVGGVSLGLLGVLEIVVAVIIYVVPSIVANRCQTVNQGAVIVVNLLLGWTCLGWIAALAMAAGGMTKDQLTGMRPVSAPAPAPTISPDGQWWRDGRQ